jgi:hypothetical protein
MKHNIYEHGICLEINLMLMTHYVLSGFGLPSPRSVKYLTKS